MKGRYDGSGSVYLDDVRSWQTDEPALDMTGAAIIAAAAQLGLSSFALDGAQSVRGRPPLDHEQAGLRH